MYLSVSQAFRTINQSKDNLVDSLYARNQTNKSCIYSLLDHAIFAFDGYHSDLDDDDQNSPYFLNDLCLIEGRF